MQTCIYVMYACNAGDTVSIPGSGRPLKKEMTTHAGVLAWRISWTDELTSTVHGSQKSQTLLNN